MIKKIKEWAKILKHDVLTLWFALKNPETPRLAKLIAFVAVTYALSPIDLIPDFIPILGYLDDFILIPIFVWISLKIIPHSVVYESRLKAKEWLMVNDKKPKSYVGLFIILGIWLLIFWMAIKHLILYIVEA